MTARRADDWRTVAIFIPPELLVGLPIPSSGGDTPPDEVPYDEMSKCLRKQRLCDTIESVRESSAAGRRWSDVEVPRIRSRVQPDGISNPLSAVKDLTEGVGDERVA